MKRLFVVLLICLAGQAFAIDPLPFKDSAEEQRFQHLARQLRCLVCQNQDLADSEAELAGDLRRQVFQMMRDGKSDAEIKTYLVSRYNDFVLYDPPVKAGTWLLWFGPGVLVLVGAGALVAILRKRSQQWGQSRLIQTDATAQRIAGSIDSDPIDSEEDW